MPVPSPPNRPILYRLNWVGHGSGRARHGIIFLHIHHQSVSRDSGQKRVDSKGSDADLKIGREPPSLFLPLTYSTGEYAKWRDRLGWFASVCLALTFCWQQMFVAHWNEPFSYLSLFLFFTLVAMEKERRWRREKHNSASNSILFSPPPSSVDLGTVP